MKNSQIIKEMSLIYNKKINYFLNESGVYDKHGNNIVNQAIGLKVFEKDTGYRYHVGGYHKEDNKEYLVLLHPDQPSPTVGNAKSDNIIYDDYSVDSRSDKEYDYDISNNKDSIENIDINDLEEGTYILVPISEFDKKYTYKREK